MASNSEQIRRVLFKLNELFLEGSDFDDRRWIFDWNDTLSLDANLENVWNEDRALETLTKAGIIQSRSIDNEYKHQHDKSVAAHGEKAIVWGDWYKTDSARREYEYERWIDGFNYKDFQRFCELHGFNPSSEGVIAHLELLSGVTPVVVAQEERFILPTLGAGRVTQKVIAYAANHPDIRQSLDELRANVNAPQLAADNVNINQLFKKNIFSNTLSSFAEISPRSFMLKSQALIIPSELEEIRRTSTR